MTERRVPRAAEIGGTTLEIVRDWVPKFNAEGPDGLVDREAPGQLSRLNDTHRAALTRVIEAGPIPAAPSTAALSKSQRRLYEKSGPSWCRDASVKKLLIHFFDVKRLLNSASDVVSYHELG